MGFSTIDWVFMGYLRNIYESRLAAFRSDSSSGFMGYTHALSAFAVVLAVLAFAPQVFKGVIDVKSIPVVLMFVFTAVGASMVPDLDNTASRAKSDLGFFGVLLSGVFRVSSSVIQTTIRTKRDDPEPNPHRGFWHTIPAALLLGGLVVLGTNVKGHLTLPFAEKITWGDVIGLVVVFLMVHLTLSSIGKGVMDKIKKSNAIGEFIALGISIVITYSLFVLIPGDLSLWWLGVAVAGGMLIHIVGDTFTTAGTPILFPLSAVVKGKFWWTTRFLKIKAGGAFENIIFVPAFSIIIVVSLIKIFVSSGVF